MNFESFISELHDIGFFFQAILEVAVFTGFAAVVLIAVGYELQSKRRV